MGLTGLKEALLAVIFVLFLIKGSRADSCSVADDSRFDCYPGLGASEEKCKARGCCWVPAASRRNPKMRAARYNVSNLDTPYCFYPSDFGGYKVSNVKNTDMGFMIYLELNSRGGPYGNNYKQIVADVSFETQTRLRVTIRGADDKRYRVPVPIQKVTQKSASQDYDITYQNSPFSFQVKRKSTGKIIFDTSAGPMIFSNQFLQIASALQNDNIYGLGEHVLPFKLSTQWQLLTLFARDIGDPPGGVNLYGVFPYYMNIENDGNAHGVFLLNSNAQDIILQPKPAITFRTVGGILDFFFFMGPTPNDVIQQYTDLVGKPIVPPYWSLGFHLCRWGYGTIERMQEVDKNMADNKIPLDTQWNDIEYMDRYLDFSVDSKKWHGLSQYVDDLHNKGMHYVMIIDPGISNQYSDYHAYKRGMELDVFIKDSHGQPLVGKVWPGLTVYPDFFHPNAQQYWTEMIDGFQKTIKFDGLWIDMNEPSNFVYGSTQGCPDSSYNTPPYMPSVASGQLPAQTICMTAKQYNGIHYDLHSLYGYSEGVATQNALMSVRKKRSLVIGRSTFPGSGSHQGHWTGDNHANWDDLYKSIPGILNFQMFGIPLVGADICGFQGDTNVELCTRWMQLGAFYPFSRNHNTINVKAQDPPSLGQQVIVASRNALNLRYLLLPYLYTLFYEASFTGHPVARALLFEFPKDANTYAIDQQFMWGNALLISPVIKQGASSVMAYFPSGIWYSLTGGPPINSTGQTLQLPASLEYPNLHMRGGFIAPTQKPGLTTTASRKNPLGLYAALDDNGEAHGTQFIDDGEVLQDMLLHATNVTYTVKDGVLTSYPGMANYKPEVTWDDLVVFGIKQSPGKVTINGAGTSSFQYDQKQMQLTVSNMKLSILQKNTIQWN
ncbi:lysosomal alpha-glucosidase-like [Rhopilema esculentum]|uniref:lysosomal alpha-glucosidase-like n=1 Tax=Rhopilema esculentum TaxID=499914 RepID=UPI0031DD001B